MKSNFLLTVLKLGSHQQPKQRRRRFILPFPLAHSSVPVHTWKLDRSRSKDRRVRRGGDALGARVSPPPPHLEQKKKERFFFNSIEHPLVLPSPFSWFTLERKDSFVSVFMVHTFSWFTLEREDSSVSVFMVHTKTSGFVRLHYYLCFSFVASLNRAFKKSSYCLVYCRLPFLFCSTF